ncbi:UDP-galactose/UDP-glucose transporter 3 [Nymphaea thermarum]|nr:UDP-galactose/UDP-glucose transporter 3 [Nymphaea thermarum]
MDAPPAFHLAPSGRRELLAVGRARAAACFSSLCREIERRSTSSSTQLRSGGRRNGGARARTRAGCAAGLLRRRHLVRLHHPGRPSGDTLWSPRSKGGAPWWSYWSPSITNTIGPAMGIEALKYISYPAQVLAKSSKMIPVMLMGTLVYGIKYTFSEYVCTLLVAGGVSAFALLKTSSKTISKLAHPNAPLGYGLCFLNLALDGFTNATQDSLTLRYPKTTAWDIMLGMNLWGIIYNGLYMFGWSHGIGYEAIQFCKEHPEAAWDIFLFCMCGAVGQNFIFMTISRFGSLTNTTITTTRKFVSIVVSSLLSGNPLSAKQWGCVFMVFGGLAYQIYLKWNKQKKKKKSK